MSDIRWLPLEANPEVMNKFLMQLGVPKKYGISDIFSFDAEMLQFVPKPSFAIILLFPATSEDLKHIQLSIQLHSFILRFGIRYTGLFWASDCAAVFYKVSANKQFLDEKQVKESSVFFMKQTIGNACGTVALIHSVANNLQNICLEPDSPLEKFLKETVQLGPDEKAEYLEKNMDIGAAHEASAQEGQTEPPPSNEEVSLHFVAFVNSNGKLLELDGRKDGPICHRSTSVETFFEKELHNCIEALSCQGSSGNQKSGCSQRISSG
ncbi:ubiquitin carboxyl-terminal hydrolase isozyme L3-like [Uloborus diversus]|uniref:ubiquitin carboxyl-terminal hydrolase isozyme L3-like n=1 Tax=Uloborus diversus TaxID=327109 RepID=UPI0024096868|nr:ubiquitin carboxyl-terminal hydrolase isozyme L3-like [Uloborus diversus]